MKSILALCIAASTALAGCAVVPIGPPVGVGVYVAPGPVVVRPGYGHYYGGRGGYRRW